MRSRVRAVAALILGMIFLLAGAAVLATPAEAAQPVVGQISASAAAATSPVSAPDELHITGSLKDTRFSPAKPVSGVRINVTTPAGKPVGTATSNAQGTFSIPIGKADSALGKTFVIKIDTSTLPPGTVLRNPKQVELRQQITITSDIVVTFPIGANPNPPTPEWEQGIQLAIGGIVFSLLLAMASLGLSMIYGTTGLTNFAHGELITFGALVAFAVDQLPGTIKIFGYTATLFVGILAAIVFGGAFGWLLDRALWRPLRHRGTGLVAAMIVSIGLAIFLRNIFQFFAGADNHNYSQWATPEPWHIGAVLVTPKSFGVAVFAAIVLLLVTTALQRTRLGKAMRAVADNPPLAASSGINVDRVISAVWIGGAALAGLSGVLLGMTQGFDYQLGFKILLLVFAAVVLGGLGTIWGAILGSFVIGIFIEVSTLIIPAELKFVGALGILILVLLVRPQGLLGRSERVG